MLEFCKTANRLPDCAVPISQPRGPRAAAADLPSRGHHTSTRTHHQAPSTALGAETRESPRQTSLPRGERWGGSKGRGRGRYRKGARSSTHRARSATLYVTHAGAMPQPSPHHRPGGWGVRAAAPGEGQWEPRERQSLSRPAAPRERSPTNSKRTPHKTRHSPHHALFEKCISRCVLQINAGTRNCVR